MVRSVVIFYLLFISQYCLSAQSKSSLIQITKSSDLHERYEAFLALTDKYEYIRNDSALWASLEAVKIADQIGNYQMMAHAYRIAGIYYADVGLYDKSIESLYKSIDYYERTGNSTKDESIAGCYHNLAWNYAYMEQYDQVVTLFHKSMTRKPLISCKDSINHAISFHALGSFYFIYDSQYDSAEYYLLKAITWRKHCRAGHEEVAQAEVELSQAYYESNQLEKGDEILNHILAHPKDSVSDYIKLYTDFLQGVRLHQEGRYKEAMEKFIPVYEIGEANNSHLSSSWINLLRQMLATAEAGNLYEHGFYYLNKLRDAERQTIYKDRQRTTKALEISYETKRKENQILEQRAQLKLQQRVLWAVGIGASLILLLAFFLFKSYRQIRIKNRKIETLMRELHHRVKNNLQVISSLLGLQSMKLDDITAQKAVDESKERIRAMSLIHQKLYQQEEITALNIHEYIGNLVGELAQSYGFSQRVKINLDVPSILLDVDTTLPVGLIINELVSNAFKYAYTDIEKPILDLKLLQEKNQYILSIKDNGMGLPLGFDMDEAKSFGLKLVKLLTKQLNGNLIVKNDNGLEFQLSFNLDKF